MLANPRERRNLPHPPAMLLTRIVRLNQPHRVTIVLADVEVRVVHDLRQFGHVCGQRLDIAGSVVGCDGGEAEEAGEIPDQALLLFFGRELGPER